MCTVSFFTEMMFVKTFLTEEGLEPETEHVERGHECGDQPDGPKQFVEWVVGDKGAIEDLVFGEEACERREACDSEDTCGHRPEGNRDTLAKAAHVAHV